jgi:hypothetical protein
LGVKDSAEKNTNSMICIAEWWQDAEERHMLLIKIIEADE